jgi:hypothetical protein
LHTERRYTPPTAKTIPFEYTGNAAIAVIGAATGTRYGFPGPGVRVNVDERDARYLAKVPGMRAA